MTSPRSRHRPHPHGDPADLVDGRWNGAPVRMWPPTTPTLLDCLDRGVLRWPDAPLVVGEDGAVTTYRQFADAVAGACRRLSADGVQRGDRVAVCLPNGLDIAVGIWAAAAVGAVFVGLSPKLAPDALAYQLGHSRPVLVLADPAYLAVCAEATALAGLPAERTRAVGDTLVGAPARWQWPLPNDQSAGRPGPSDTYAVIYTSGTTGRPKAIRMTHQGTMQAAEQYVRSFALGPDDRTAVTFPFHYLSGHVTQLTPAMLSGGSVVPVTRLHPRTIVALCDRLGVTWLDVVPALLSLVAATDGFAEPALPALRLAVYGGSPVLPGLVDRLRALRPSLELVDTYGMTETAVAFCLLADDEQGEHAGTVGRPVPTAELSLREPDGTPSPDGAAGELWVRGPWVTPGYDGDPAATAEALVDGWLRTGDVAAVDADGYVRILDRVKDMIIRSGQKVFSAEVEACLAGHPAVAQVAAFGLPDRVTGETVACWVVPEPGATVDAADLRRWVTGRLAAWAAPSVVRVVDALPRNPTGKPDKKAMRAAGR